MQPNRLKARTSNMPTLIDLMIVVAVIGIIGIESVFILVGIALLATAAYLSLMLLLSGIRLLGLLLTSRASDDSRSN